MNQQADASEPFLGRLAPYAATVLGLFGTVAGLAAVGSGDRIFRNHPFPAAAGVAALILALLCTAIAMLLQQGSARAPAGAKHRVVLVSAAHWLTIASLVVFIVALGLSLCAVLLTAGDHYEPSVTATVTEASGVMTLDGEVKASGVRSDSHVVTVIYASNAKSLIGSPFYIRSDGPDTEGKVDVKLNTRLDALNIANAPNLTIKAWQATESSQQEPDCGDKQKETCLFLPLPASGMPEIAVGSDGDVDKGAEVTVKVHADRVPTNQAIGIEAIATVGQQQLHVYRAMIGPTVSGSVDEVLKFATSQGTSTVCVVAKVEAALHDLTCGPNADSQSTWADITSSTAQQQR